MVDEQVQVQEESRAARIAATSMIAVGALVLLFAAAGVVFFLLAELLQGAWLPAGVLLVVLAGLYLLAKRFVRVAANQNKNPLG